MKKKHPEHVNLERWLVSYADFITMLFAFFVVLWATSQADIQKFAAVAQSMRTAFGTGAGPLGVIDLGGTGGGSTVNPFEQMEPPGGRALNLPAGRFNTAADPDPGLQEVREKLEESISLEVGVTSTSDRVRMEYDSRGLVLRLAAKDFFAENSVEVRQEMLPLLDRIARVMSSTRRLVRIEGHADPTEKKPEGYPTSWELSSARAAWVARYWLSRYDFEPRRIGVAGYGHYRPLADSKGVYDTAANRRVEIIVLNNRYEEEE
jgi:chemotaxis protein MotB